MTYEKEAIKKSLKVERTLRGKGHDLRKEIGRISPSNYLRRLKQGKEKLKW